MMAPKGRCDSIPRARSVLLVFLSGAPSQLDTFDPKPDAPAEVRGEFATISTSAPGISVAEHIPKIARQMHHLCVVRSMTMDRSLAAHDFGSHAILAGVDHPPGGPTRAASRLAWPCYAAGLHALRGNAGQLPAGVHLPILVRDSGIGVYPGQNGGLLGTVHDPIQLQQDPNAPDFRYRACDLPAGLSASQLDQRMGLLADIDRQQAALNELAPTQAMTRQQSEAVQFLAHPKLARAFDLERESDRVRQRYGRHFFGQSLLLARRLIQAGVPIVQANLSQWQAQWDTHADNFNLLRKTLLPPFDQAFATLIDDMSALGLLDETLVVAFGEFGRTPKIGGNIGTPTYSPTGRDHWCDCFFACFAGAGVRGGSVVGASDKWAAYPATKAFTPADFGATIYEAIGVDPASIVTDRLGRPITLNQGTAIRPIYTGESV